MASTVKLPINDPNILGTSRGLVTVLWAIREHGPLTFEKLFEMLFSSAANVSPTSSDVRNLRTTAVNIAENSRLLAEALERLQDAGVIKIEGGELASLKHITSATLGAAIKAAKFRQTAGWGLVRGFHGDAIRGRTEAHL